MKFKKEQGFTLIEMLLVLAIIGILAGAIFTLIGNSSDAKTKSALSTAKSMMPYAQECYFKGDDLDDPGPVDNHDGGGALCPDSETNWPGLGPDDCNHTNITSDSWDVLCTFSSGNVTISCSASGGNCAVN